MVKNILFGVCCIFSARSEFGHDGEFANRFTQGLDLAADNVVADSDSVIGCCRGIDSACTTTSESTCEKNSKRKGCEWMWGTETSLPDCSDPTPEPGCCYGADSKCWDEDEETCYKNARKAGCEWLAGKDVDCTPPTAEPGCCAGAEADCQVDWLDEASCDKLSRKKGCEWRSGKDADCTMTTPLPGCCYGESSKCQQDDMTMCVKMASRAGCEWRTDTADAPADCTPPTAEPGCCAGSDSKCTDTDDEVMCNKLARKSGCEWISGKEADCTPTSTTTTTTTEAPPMSTAKKTTTVGGPATTGEGCATNHRHRVSWQETTEANRQLYINGFKTLADAGVMSDFTQCHLESSEHSNHEFLPWHREFVYRLEEAIRGLGGEYECFTLPYWDWTMEPTPYDVKWNGDELFILNSGLGGDGNGQCLTDDVWGTDAYTPNGGPCLTRDLDYPDESSVCTFYSASQIMEVIDYSDMYSTFRPMIEGTPHALPHVCIGGDDSTFMATYYSPDDPIFYLHHTFVDFIWAVWQDCNNYDGVDPESYSDEYADRTNYQLQYSPLSTARPYPKVESTFDIEADYDVSYEMGAFWENARVDSRQACGAETDPTNGAWFYNTMTSLKSQTKTASQTVESEIIDEVFAEHPAASYEDNIAEAADLICEERREARAGAPECVVSSLVEGLMDCGSDESAITADMVLNQQGLSPCAKSLRTRLWEWSEMMEQKQYLCRGCYDPYCDADSKAAVQAMDCGITSEAHTDDDSAWDMMALLETAQNGVVNNVNVLVMAVAVLMMLAAKSCLERAQFSKKVQVMNAVRDGAYGAV